jgi:glutathione synthase/RimK-type ligase-like ATP-grasp enzyme
MKDKAYEDSELVEVFVAPNELMATMVKDILESEGIDAIIRSDQIAWFDSIAKASRGYWGKVFVRSEDGERSKELVTEFLRLGDTPSQEITDEEAGDQE